MYFVRKDCAAQSHHNSVKGIHVREGEEVWKAAALDEGELR